MHAVQDQSILNKTMTDRASSRWMHLDADVYLALQGVSCLRGKEGLIRVTELVLWALSYDFRCRSEPPKLFLSSQDDLCNKVQSHHMRTHVVLGLLLNKSSWPEAVAPTSCENYEKQFFGIVLGCFSDSSLKDRVSAWTSMSRFAPPAWESLEVPARRWQWWNRAELLGGCCWQGWHVFEQL